MALQNSIGVALAAAIGPTHVLRWDGQFIQSRQHLAEIRRAGVSGTGFKALGTWGDTFQLASVVDVTNLTTAGIVQAAYISLIELGAQTLVVDGINTGVVKVVDVIVPGPPVALVCVSGGLNVPNGNAGYEVRATWKMAYL